MTTKKNYWKKLAVVAAAAGLITIASCSDDIVKAKFGMDFTDIEFIVNPTTVAGTVEMAENDVETKIDSLLSANKAKKSNIKSVKLKSLTLEMLDGTDSTNFRVFEAFKVEINSADKPDFVTLGELQNNPDVEAYTLEVPVNTDVNYADYLKSSTISYKITGTTRDRIKNLVHIKGKAKFDVEAGL